jgi:hypothetical protein
LELAAAIKGVVAGIVTSLLTPLLRDRLFRQNERRKRQIETDRALYGMRETQLIVSNLSAFIRTARCFPGDQDDFAELIQNIIGSLQQT